MSVSTSIIRYNRCKWLFIIAIMFLCGAVTSCLIALIQMIGFNLSEYDSLLWASFIIFIFAGMFFVMWISCQIEVHLTCENQTKFEPLESFSSSPASQTSEYPFSRSNSNHVIDVV